MTILDGTNAPQRMNLNFHSPLPLKKDWRIGVLGAGFIVNDCHLPAYRKAGFNPVAIASRTRESAAKVAEQHSLKVYSTYESLLDNAEIDVLDIAVPPNVQLDMIKAACERGTVKGILAQKPLGMNYRDAVEAVEACEKAGITLAVNQNMRYDQSVRAAKTLLENGTIGAPVIATIDMRGIPHWMPWQKDLGWVTMRIMSIHHIDCFRYWFGEPERIYASFRTDPRTTFPHKDGICSYILEYANGLRCIAIDDTWTGPAREGAPADNHIIWRIEGLNGLAMGDIGWCKDPYTTPSEIYYGAKGDTEFHTPTWSESWFPDAFIGTMAQLLIALETGDEPAISARDNLATMALVDAAYRSAEERRAISPAEITSGVASPHEIIGPREFTEHSMTVLGTARNEASRNKAPEIGTEHLLLGLAKLGEGESVKILDSLKLTESQICAKLSDASEKDTSSNPSEVIPQSASLKKTLTAAAHLAGELGHSHIGSVHLIIGLLETDEGGAHKLFKELKINVAKSAVEIRESLAKSN